MSIEQLQERLEALELEMKTELRKRPTLRRFINLQGSIELVKHDLLKAKEQACGNVIRVDFINRKVA